MTGRLSFIVGGALVAYFALRVLPDLKAHRGRKKMSTDYQGNYDLDGVSYDPQSHIVAVAGDNRIPDPITEAHVAQDVVDMHAPASNLGEPKRQNLA